jgi:hypothetical protein
MPTPVTDPGFADPATALAHFERRLLLETDCSDVHEALKAGADFAKGTRFAAGGGSADITVVRRLGNAFLNGVFNLGFRTRYTDLCYGYNAFWADLLPVLALPPIEAPAPAEGMPWGDGFEIETVINCRFAAAQVSTAEVPSVEKLRMFGESNLRAVRDGTRVLRTLVTEWRRARAVRRMDRRLSQPTVAEPAAATDRVAA